ncbi:hypothetical protein ACIGXA_12015 [Streptomyces fildesensis]|uniref:Lipoprotein n=1 Tax=Streptomyces fildesensis TaxID=375757 RepID=A0ABW8C488_9ACTN
MSEHWTPAVVTVLVVLLIVVTAIARSRWFPRHPVSRPRRLRRDAKAGLQLLYLLPLLALSACTSANRAPDPEEVRKLAGGSQAVHVRQQEEQNFRDVVRSYADHTSLTLALVTVRDVCRTGKAKELLDSGGDDTYKVACSLSVTAYFGADPAHVGDVLDSILTARNASGSRIPFGYDDFRTHLVAYYRGHGPNPLGPNMPETTFLSDQSQTLAWDPVHDHDPRSLIAEPERCAPNDPPMTRCLREPSSGTVAAVRHRYGMVFRLELGAGDYYKVFKSGQVETK